eukprot:CAMPEP_0204269186 /NCGR_PEP_ID=MMETSP0468-20130131/15631_1 /ASSEMBLY_ACC=CAM_ASM_000383 /TAXON_ID=2969 /ORGANISM="Oxyrrhis marina" /LENGTH=153 /DNA_ID=CAMNT_0051244543 /DNA_START=214 /DNA_END=676 /DNA_ORIENTATION=+
MVVAITSLVVLILLDDQVAKWATCEQVRELLSSLPASLMVETLILTAMAVVIASFLPRTKRFFTACARMLNRTKRTVTIAVAARPQVLVLDGIRAHARPREESAASDISASFAGVLTAVLNVQVSWLLCSALTSSLAGSLWRRVRAFFSSWQE